MKFRRLGLSRVGKDAKNQENQALEFEDFAEKKTFNFDASCSLSNTEDAPPGVPGLDCRVDLGIFSVSFINES